MSYQTQMVEIKNRVKVTFVVNQYGAISFQPQSVVTPTVIYGTILGVDDFGMNLKVRLEDTPTKPPFLIPLVMITSIDQNTVKDEGTWGGDLGFFVRAGDPIETIGRDGNVWFDTISPNRVYCKEHGIWVYKCSLKGERGFQGVPGWVSERSFIDTIGLQISHVYTNLGQMEKDYMEVIDDFKKAADETYIMKQSHRFGDIVCYVDPNTLDIELYLSTPLTEIPKSTDMIQHQLINDHVRLIESSGLLYYGKLTDKPGMIRGLPGRDAATPYIEPTSNRWYVGGTDTGVCAVGVQGVQGVPGTSGRDGKDGVDGKPGPQGIPGKNGDSMYYNPSTDKFYIGVTDVTPAMEQLVERAVRKFQTFYHG